MDYKAVDFDESAGVHKGVDSFSSGHLSPRMLRFYLLGSAAEFGLFSFLLQLIEPLRHAHWFEKCQVDSLYKSRVKILVVENPERSFIHFANSAIVSLYHQTT